ncbi:MAG: PAS domain-containing protein [Propionivibrio sp.]|uniref:ATP-binding protein n=1 Tax=Propionivibrio sp. TaxID=2212460 RepID=UPI001B49E567|nr:ATP-binding protein [Propionivibrio sp.]MBP7204538.1 PAS domain-containing protein [Propionivibrio sp.]
MHEAIDRSLLEFIVERLEAGVFVVDRDYRVVLWNRFMAMHSQRSAKEVVGRNLFESFPELPQKWLARKIEGVFILKNYAFTSWEQRPFLFRFNHNRPITGGIDAMRQNCILLPQKDAAGEVKHVCVTLLDFTDTAMYQMRLNELIDQLKEEKAAQQVLIGKLEDAQGQLLQSEKMASVGQLAAGVAHEINNPIGFVNSNLGSLKGQVESLLSVLSAYEEVENALKGQPDLLASLQQAKVAADLDFLRDDILDLINESLDGVQRVKKIVENLRDFSRVDASEWHYANLEQGLESTLNIVWNEIKYKAEVVREYAGLPDVECIAAQINQVFMNLLVNAAHAIAERGTITLRTGFDEREVWVEIEDTGVGIKQENLKRVFEPFFTTKPIGKGTGLGLSLAYGIVQRHQGRLEVQSEPGKGTRFRLTLPRHHTAQPAPGYD